MMRRGLFLAALALSLPTAALAQSQDRFSTDVNLTAGYTSNPFSIDDDDTGSALLSVDFLPRYTVETARSTLTVAAAARLQQYLRRYSGNENYSGSVDYAVTPSERLNAHVQASISSSVLGSYNNFFPTFVDPGVIDPGTGNVIVPDPATGADVVAQPGVGSGIIDPGVGLPVNGDIGLFGFRQRRKSGRIAGDLGYAVGARDSITLNGYTEISRYDQNFGLGDYDAYGLGAGYSHQLSQNLSFGVQGSGDRYNYSGEGADTRVYSIQGTVQARLSSLWSINGALGVSFVDSGDLGSTDSTSLSGNINACRLGQRSTACIQASRSVRPTGLLGSQYTSLIGLNWSMRLTERENVSLNASYSKVGGGDRLFPGAFPLSTEYASAGAAYSRAITERLRFVASANARKLFGNGRSSPSDFGGQIGVSYRYGDLR